MSIYIQSPAFSSPAGEPKRLALFGSTGSIGTQALEVVRDNKSLFRVSILTAQSNADLLIEQAKTFLPDLVVIGDAKKYAQVKEALTGTDTEVLQGEDGLLEAAAADVYDTMLAAIVVFAGLAPTIEAIKNGKDIALANKETLVIAGDYIMNLVKQKNTKLIPVDSEHSAIFQCLQGEEKNPIEKIILTASGGPFLGRKPNYLMNVKREHALQHPNWNMGAKISIDSSTLMNKGLEMIEAKWLFDLAPDQIKVIIHPQSIIHSMVQFEDGSIKAQMGLPDMKLPIQYALAHPQRLKNEFPRYDFKNIQTLSFEEPDVRTFRNLTLATQALQKGGNLPAIMNAANEIVVFAFLRNRLNFLDMTHVIEKTMEKISFIEKPTYDDYLQSDAEARSFAADMVQL